tara:strand:+ start:1956 stop:2894 length:939 start_codon:yes stop_codon:yes gene_type:complete
MPDEITNEEEPQNIEDEVVQEEPEPVSIDTPEPEVVPESLEEKQFTNEHYGLGYTLGLSPEQVDNFGSVEAFESMASTVVTPRAGVNQQLLQQTAVNSQPPEQYQPMQHLGQTPQQQPQQQQQQAQQPQRDFSFEDADDYDDELVKMNDHTNQRLGEIEGYLSQLHQENAFLRQQEQFRQAESISREFDELCNSLPEKEFGRGQLNDVPQGVAMNRYKLADAVARAGHGYLDRHQPVPAMVDLVKEAMNGSFTETVKNNVLQKASQQSQQIADQSVAEPASSEEPSINGEMAAERAVAEYYKEKGIPGGAFE